MVIRHVCLMASRSHPGDGFRGTPLDPPNGVLGAIQVLPIGYLRLRPARFEERWAGERGDFCFFFLKER